MSYRDLCFSLAQCETENEVITILQKEGFWDDPSCWRYYGDIEDNFSTIGNQQSSPEYALVEKLVNSVDAVLLNRCLEDGIDPKSNQAPRNITEALVRFFNIPDGKLSRLTPLERTALAENISLVATGTKSNPCYSVIDKGEGQTPETMPKTLLGLFKSIKSEIPFVQGKFHMGGTGALRFCGENHIQLVISRRNPRILKPGESDKWGFTVVRRENPRGKRRTSVYTYLAPGGEVLSFRAHSLPLLPSEYPQAFGKNLDWGTYIKLYEYKIAGLKTNILFDLYYALSLLMPNIALPVRLFERRKGYSGHTFETTLSGLVVRLEEDKRENLEPGYPSSHTISCLGQRLNVQIFAFKQGQAVKYRRNEGIIFTVNGQTHGHLSHSFFQREGVGMGYLRDSLLVIVDCTDLDDRSKEDLFMNSRDRLCDCELKTLMEKQLEQLLKEHPGLRELKEKRRQEEIKNKLQESKPAADIIEKVIKNSPTLLKLLSPGGRISNPFQLIETGTGKDYKGKKYPTYFRLKKKTQEYTKECPVNWRFRVQFETDASNDYFKREDDPGEFTLLANGLEVSNYVLSLWNGIANLTVSLPPNAKPNNIIKYVALVKDATIWEPFRNEFAVVVMAPKKHQESGSDKRHPSPSDKNGQGAHSPSRLSLPQIFDVRRDKWTEHGFDEFDALDIVSIGDGKYDFYVNMDNICLQNELKYANPATDVELITAQFRTGVVLIGMQLISELSRLHSKGLADRSNESIPEKVKLFTRAISPILIPMISTLSALQTEEIEPQNTVTFE